MKRKPTPPGPWCLTPRYKPTAPPFVEQSPAMWLKRPYVACWINTQGVPVKLSCCHLRKTAEAAIRYTYMSDGSSPDMNKADRYYIWDSSLPWNPEHLASWTPIADHPANQWVPSR